MRGVRKRDAAPAREASKKRANHKPDEGEDKTSAFVLQSRSVVWFAWSMLAGISTAAAGPETEAQQATSYPVRLFADPAGDATRPVATPTGAGAPTDPLDVTALLVRAESTDSLEFEISTSAMPQGTKGDLSPNYHTARYDLNFSIPAAGVKYNLRVDLAVFKDTENPASVYFVSPASATGCIFLWEAACSPFAFAAVPDRALPGVVIRLDKADLAGAIDGRRLVDITAQTVLRDFHVDSYLASAPTGADAFGSNPLQSVVRDSAPNEGVEGAYALVEGADLSPIAVSFTDSSFPVVLGATRGIPLRIENRGDRIEYMNLTYHATEPSGLTLSGPSSLSLPPGQGRNYTLGVKLPVESREVRPWYVRVEGTSSASNRTFTAVTRLEPALDLTPTRTQLYLHAWPSTSAPNPISPITGPDPRRAFLAEMPDASGSDGAVWIPVYFEGLRDFEAWRRTAHPTAFTDAPFTLKLRLAGPDHDVGDVRAVAELRYGPPGGDRLRTFASFATEFRLTTDPQTVEMQTTAPKGLEIPSGDVVHLTLQVTILDETKRILMTTRGEFYRVQAQETFLDLPISELPFQYREHLSLSPFNLEVAGESSEFVNPGESRLFRATVANSARTDQRLQLAVNLSKATWGAAMLPAERFVLKPADSVHVGLLVTAPDSAGEGEEVQIVLRAMAEDGSEAQQALVVRATSGADLADDTGAYTPDALDLDKVEKPAPKTPALPVILVLTGVAAMAWRRR